MYRVDANKAIGNERINGKAKLEGLRMKSLSNGNGVRVVRAQLGTGLENEREGVKIGREREAAHAGEEEESRER